MGVLITGSGLYTPKQSISNEELVASYNTYVDSYNNENKLLIDTGEIEPLIHSDTDFIKKVSGIEQRFVLDKEGILDPERMRPNLVERSNEEISIQAEHKVHWLTNKSGYKNQANCDLNLMSQENTYRHGEK